MSNYTKSTDFASKDSLASGNAAKIVKGTEIDTEFNNIATAVATKADLASPTFTGSPVLPANTTGATQSSGDNTTKLATTAFVQAALSALYPVGSIYTNASSSTNPGTLLGFGAGRVMVGLDASDSSFDTAEETGGSKNAIVVSHTHTATVTDPGHTHLTRGGGDTNAGVVNNTPLMGATTFTSNTSGQNISTTTGISVSNSTEGSSGTNANLQPYIVVYMWKRTA